MILKVNLKDGFKAYVDQFKVDLINVQDFKISGLKISPQKEIVDKFTKVKKNILDKKGEISFAIEAPANLNPPVKSLILNLKYQICSQSFCLLPANLEMLLPFDLSQFISVNPASANINQDSNHADILGAPINISNFNLEQSLQSGLLWTFILTYLLGIITSFTPCIFPMIPVTLTVLTRSAETHRRFRHLLITLIYVLGICVTYSVLGFLAAKTGSLFGSFMSHPIVLLGLTVLFLTMALSMFGFFEFSLSGRLYSRLQKFSSQHDWLAAFITGLLAGIAASPCVGPVLVTILAFVAKTQNEFLGLSLLFVYAFGMGTIFIVLGLSSQLINKLPRSGPWLKNVKHFLGTLMILVVVYYGHLFYKSITKNSAKNSSPEISSQSLTWISYSDAELSKALNQSKPILIDLYADWCVACHELESRTFSHKEISNLLRENFILMRFDASQPSEQLEILQKKYGFVGLPTILFLKPDGSWIKDMTLNQFEEYDQFIQRLNLVLKESRK